MGVGVWVARRGGGRLVGSSDVDGRNARRIPFVLVIRHTRNIDLRNTPRTVNTRSRHINLRPTTTSLPLIRFLIIRHPRYVDLRDGPCSRARRLRHSQGRNSLPLHSPRTHSTRAPTHTPTNTRVRNPWRSTRTRARRVGVWCSRGLRRRRRR